MRWIIPLLLLAAPALGAPPDRLVMPVTLYAEDLGLWSPERVDQAMTMADQYLDKCAIDLEWAPVRPLPPGADGDWEALWRTPRQEELVLLLRAPGDRRHYRLAGVANLWRVNGRWMGEGPWTDIALALAQEIGRGTLTRWPKPVGPSAGEAIAKARLALMFAVGMGWITLEPAVSDGHCEFLYKRFDKLRQKKAARPPQVTRLAEGQPVKVKGTPSAVLVADVPNRDAWQVLVRVADRWQMFTWLRGIGLRREPTEVPAAGDGLSLLRVGGASLLLSARPQGGVQATWAHTQPGRRKAFRPDRALEGCASLLAADSIRPGTDPKDNHPGVAAVVCPDRVLQLTPLPGDDERADALPPMTWATLTRWGPGRSRLVAGHADGVKVYEIWPGHPPRAVPTPPAVAALAAANPQAPIWQAIGAAPVQITPDTLHGPGGARPLGKGVTARFSPNQYKALRIQGQTAQVDGLYGARGGRAELPAGALWTTQVGDYGPMLWVLAPEEEGWRLSARAEAPPLPKLKIDLPRVKGTRRWIPPKAKAR